MGGEGAGLKAVEGAAGQVAEEIELGAIGAEEELRLGQGKFVRFQAEFAAIVAATFGSEEIERGLAVDSTPIAFE